jgi:hypothetical protein
MVKIKKTRKLKGGTHNDVPFTEEQLQLLMGSNSAKKSSIPPTKSSMRSSRSRMNANKSQIRAKVSFKNSPIISANGSRMSAQNLNSQIAEIIEEEAKLTKSIKDIKELSIKLERDDSKNDPNRKKVQVKQYADLLVQRLKEKEQITNKKIRLHEQKVAKKLAKVEEIIKQRQSNYNSRTTQIMSQRIMRREANETARREEQMRQGVLARRKQLEDNKERNLQKKAILKILQEYTVKYSREQALHSKKSVSTVIDEPLIILEEMESKKKTLGVINNKLFVIDEFGNMRPFKYDDYKSYKRRQPMLL